MPRQSPSGCAGLSCRAAYKQSSCVFFLSAGCKECPQGHRCGRGREPPAPVTSWSLLGLAYIDYTLRVGT